MVAIAFVASGAEASLTNPTGRELTAFFKRHPQLKKGMVAALKLEKNGPSTGRKLLESEVEIESEGRKLLCASYCKTCITVAGVKSCSCLC